MNGSESLSQSLAACVIDLTPKNGDVVHENQPSGGLDSEWLFSDSNADVIGNDEANGSDGPQIAPQISQSASGHGLKGKVKGSKLFLLLEIQKKKCALTGIDLTPATVSLDHIIPIASGGPDDMSNVQLVHVKINEMKGVMANDEFVQWCMLVAKKTGPLQG